jgi:phosphohistidine phosphatase
MRLYLAQHGEALAKDVDPERPLSEQGAADVAALATFLKGAGVRVERAWHSGKRRAEQTAAGLARGIAPKGTVEAIDGIKPNDPVEVFAEDADVWDQDTLVVGHLPFLARLVALLVTGDAGGEVAGYTPGSIVCLERADTHWVIRWMFSPELFRGGAS